MAFLGEDFPGECPAGAAVLIDKVRATLNRHFRGDDKPDVVFTDRGQGFFNIGNGKVTSAYSSALQANGLRAFMGADASRQPGDLKELMLHETAVAWLTNRLTVTTPRKAWEESPLAFQQRLRDACDYINTHYNVDSLCRELPQRVSALRQCEGGRLRK